MAFGLLTVFWPDITPLSRAIATGLYLVVSGATVIFLLLSIRRGLATAVGMLWLEASLFLLGGILAMIFQDAVLFAVVTGLTLLLTGLLEVYLGFRYRSRTVLGRDWLITGGVAALAAVLLFPLAGTSLRAPVGVLGGSAVIIGVVAVLAALSYRHDGGRAAVSGEKQALPGVE
nr:DUF308 domain-containing protein [Psychromicrobium silvestre]